MGPARAGDVTERDPVEPDATVDIQDVDDRGEDVDPEGGRVDHLTGGLVRILDEEGHPVQVFDVPLVRPAPVLAEFEGSAMVGDHDNQRFVPGTGPVHLREDSAQHPVEEPELIEMTLERESVPLMLSELGGGPDPDALSVARSLSINYVSWRPVAAQALFEHFAPYREAIAAGKIDAPREVLSIVEPDDVWRHVRAIFVLISRVSVEIGLQADWDEEHTLGARYRGGEFIELCGSVQIP